MRRLVIFTSPLFIILLCSIMCHAENSLAKKVAHIPRIVHGEKAELGEFPYQLSLKIAQRESTIYRSFCGASLVSPTKVLSAAHCFSPEDFVQPNVMNYISPCFVKSNEINQDFLDRVYVVAGTLRQVARLNTMDSLETGQWRQFNNVKYLKTYEFPSDDIAVGIVKEKFNYNANVGPIPLSTKYKDYVGYKCIISGFGRVDDTKSSKHLLWAYADVISVKSCTDAFKKSMSKFVCIDIKSSDVGKGDSGGPLVCTGTEDPAESKSGVLVGITSGSAIKLHTSIFCRVSDYSSFIGSRTESAKSNVVFVISIIFVIHI